VNIADVKKELSGDEKILESAFKIETVYKKHKLKLWILVIALVLYFGGYAAQEAFNASRISKANEAFIALQNDSKDKKALELLQDNNPTLAALYSYTQAVKNQDAEALLKLSENKNDVISDISRYAYDSLSKKPSKSELYKEMAIFQEAYLAIKAGDTKTAKTKLELIDERSPLAGMTGYLKHSLIKAD